MSLKDKNVLQMQTGVKDGDSKMGIFEKSWGNRLQKLEHNAKEHEVQFDRIKNLMDQFITKVAQVKKDEKLQKKCYERSNDLEIKIQSQGLCLIRAKRTY
eukprot:TRINITY_DN1542_c0_g1_i3.p4 TRINITY_DN1542_c0_g1~~TRINITY_DN1542_c0_g1_i3.p4  ORF type:complete len:100 (-),score=13.10 TRINITY_DN1542_c0_g1_i3:665-964(-)